MAQHAIHTHKPSKDSLMIKSMHNLHLKPNAVLLNETLELDGYGFQTD